MTRHKAQYHEVTDLMLAFCLQACMLLLLLGLAAYGRAARLGPPTRVQLGEGVAKDDFYTTQIKLRGEQRAVRRPIIGPVNRWLYTIHSSV